MALVFFVWAFVAAQQPVRQRPAPLAKPRPRSAVTVIDLRNATAAKKPPKRAPDAAYSPRMMSGSRSNTAVATLAPMQLSEALRGAGINVPPPDVYARLSSSRISVPGKAYMIITGPAWVSPDRIEFYTTERNPGSGLVEVSLEEAGTFIFDFLVQLENRPLGGDYWCEIEGTNLQTQSVHAEGSSEPVPQHVLVVMDVIRPSQGVGDARGIVSLRFRPKSATENMEWSLFLVDITKL